VPLQRLDGKVIAALNIGAHSERVPLDTMRKTFLPKLAELASVLQRQLI
jgi:IclR family pca regulon transcriptional regulator